MRTPLSKARLRLVGLGVLVLATIVVACGGQEADARESTSEQAREPLQAIAAEGQSSTPATPGTNLLISVVDTTGRLVREGTIQVSVVFEPHLAFYDFSYAKELSSVLSNGGLLGIEPPPGRVPATTSVQVVMSDGRTTDALVIDNDQFWNAVDPNRGYVATHTFQLGKSGKVSELIYLKPTE